MPTSSFLTAIFFTILLCSISPAPVPSLNGATISNPQDFYLLVEKNPSHQFTRATPTIHPDEVKQYINSTAKKINTSKMSCSSKVDRIFLDVCMTMTCSRSINETIIEDLCKGVEYSDAFLKEECCPIRATTTTEAPINIE